MDRREQAIARTVNQIARMWSTHPESQTFGAEWAGMETDALNADMPMLVEILKRIRNLAADELKAR